MVKNVFYVFLILVASIAAGIAVSYFRISSMNGSRAFTTYGSWRGTNNLPLNRNDLVTTQVTLFALFALPSSEAIYLYATEDNHGERLNGTFDYAITGNIKQLKAEYWSITVYGHDLYLIPNVAERYSFNRDNLKTDSAGNFILSLSSLNMRQNWIPLKRGEKFELVLRIYAGEKEFIDYLDSVALPKIMRMERI